MRNFLKINYNNNYERHLGMTSYTRIFASMIHPEPPVEYLISTQNKYLVLLIKTYN
jgi:hypothetical protein